MVKTIQSAASAYCTVAQALTYHDLREWGDITSVNGTRLSSGSLAGDTKLAAWLKRASGDVELAARVAQMYQPEDLTLLASSGTNGGEVLIGLVADLAFWHAWKHRGRKIEEVEGAKEALDLLQLLREGQRIFGFLENADAGLLQSDVETARDVEIRNGIVFQAERFFGLRANRRGNMREV